MKAVKGVSKMNERQAGRQAGRQAAHGREKKNKSKSTESWEVIRSDRREQQTPSQNKTKVQDNKLLMGVCMYGVWESVNVAGEERES